MARMYNHYYDDVVEQLERYLPATANIDMALLHAYACNLVNGLEVKHIDNNYVITITYDKNVNQINISYEI